LRDFRSRANAAGANIGYGKSAMVFVMLRDRLGSKVFDEGIRAFWATQRFKTASWDDLQAAFERASGEKLGSFFAPWLDQHALPAVAITHAYATAHADAVPGRTPGNKPYQLNIQFSKQDSKLPLRLPVEVTAGGQRETHWVSLDAARNAATLDLAVKPQTLRLDPEMRVWRQLELSQLPPILRQWKAASAPQLVNVASPAARAAVDQLAERFFEVNPKRVDPTQLIAALAGKGAVLLAGTHAEVDQALAIAGLPARPPGMAGQGSAQVWTVAGQSFQLAIISGQDAAALNALQRGLPHYGGKSWLIFEQGRSTSQGIWAAGIPETEVKSAAVLPKK
jgi:aminopeptidase N